MKKLFIVMISAFVICGSSGALTAKAANPPEISAKGAVLISADTGEIVFEKNCREKLPMASTTKIMTTLLCLESGNLDEEFVVDSEAIKVEGSSMGLQEGDIVSCDVGAYIGGFHGDCAATFACGKISPEAQDLIDVTRQSFFEGIKFAKEGYRLYDISAAIQTYVESHGYSIVREYVGHGVGAQMHEPPEIPNYGHPGRGPRLLRGMTLAIEPMVNAGTAAIRQMPDGWTVRTADGKWAAHYDNTVLITDGEPEILTAPAI